MNKEKIEQIAKTIIAIDSDLQRLGTRKEKLNHLYNRIMENNQVSDTCTKEVESLNYSMTLKEVIVEEFEAYSVVLN